MNKIKVLIVIACIFRYIGVVWAQSESPKVNNDSSVTFTIEAPDADIVNLCGTFIPDKYSIKTQAGTFGKAGKIKMSNDNGRWTYTIDSLPSELYTYYYEIDGVKALDPHNSNVLRDIADTLNYFIIGNGIADDYIEKDIKHGKIEKVWYPSDLNGMSKRRLSIYLPPTYDTDPELNFPVLYLLHGSGGDEDAWNASGRIMQIMDNLIYQKRCRPMIVVMPNGNVDLAAAPGEDPENPNVQPSALNTSSMLGKIESVFIPEVVEYVDENYRTVPNKANRAIAGLSLGGLHTLFISANNPEEFDFVGLFSAQTTNALDDEKIGGSLHKIGQLWQELKQSFPFINGGGFLDNTLSMLSSDEIDVYSNLDEKLSRQFNPAPQLYYIAVGRDDFVKKLNDDFRQKLDEGNYPYYYNETDGGHTWENWRKYLVDFLPRIFKE